MSLVTNPLPFRRAAALFGFLGVALGAFGAHGLEKLLEKNDRVDTWHTAVLYHLVHAVALLALSQSEKASKVAGWSFIGGILIFSGSLYILAVTNIRWLGAITPFGGLAFLVGWIMVAFPKR